MNKSTKNSDIDVDVNSIFNRQSRPNSPFLAVSPFFSNQYNFSRNKATQQDASRLYGKLFQSPNFGTIFEHRPIAEPSKKDQPNLPSFHDWLAPLSDLRDSHTFPRHSEPQNSKSAQAQLRKREVGLEKYKSANAHATNKISTESMVLVNPKSKAEPDNFYVRDNIVESDEQKYNLTTFYLKTFNMFSNSCSSLPTMEDMSEEPIKLVQQSKKIKKLFSKQYLPKSKSKGGDRKSKRKITCNCKNSGCVKMYCECFRENGFCGHHCKCKDCKNFENSHERANNISVVNKKQAEEFAFKLSKEDNVLKTSSEAKGCKCKKSQCKKKYCECYNEGAFCSPDCCCVDCLNNGSK